MSDCLERHVPKEAAGLDTSGSPLKPACPESLHQPQPRRPPALATTLCPPKHAQTSYVEDWLESLDQDRLKHSKSDSHLTRIPPFFQSPRIHFELEPQMPKKPTSPDPDLPSEEGSSESRTSNSLVGASQYREHNLAHNGIHLRSMRETLPEHIQSLVDDMFKARHSPEPEVESIRKETITLADLSDVGAAEATVTKYLKKHIFDDASDSGRLRGLGITEGFYAMRKEHVPSSSDLGIRLLVSQPKPDILYGYSWKAFTSKQQRQFRTMSDTEYTANSQRLIYPFLVVEFKGDGLGPTAGSLWVATNQCLGGAATCINMAERLNLHIERLPVATVSPVDTTAFSIAVNGSEARLLVSWKEGGGSDGMYYTQQVQGFLVYRPDDYILFRRFVRNVLEWGTGGRLAQIGAVLDAVQEESWKY